MRVLDYARNPTPPSGECTMGRRDCVYVTLTLHRTLEIEYATLTIFSKSVPRRPLEDSRS